MSFDVLDEHEQGELVQKWLRENAVAIATGIALGLALIFGWQQWKVHRSTQDAAAAAQYQALADAVDGGGRRELRQRRRRFDVVLLAEALDPVAARQGRGRQHGENESGFPHDAGFSAFGVAGCAAPPRSSSFICSTLFGRGAPSAPCDSAFW